MFLLPFLYCFLLAALSGPIGCLIMWSRLTFFGETIAHASIFGLFISLFFNIPLTAAMAVLVIVYCLLIEFFVDKNIHQSYLLPIFSYGILGLGLVLIEKFTPSSAMLFNILLGDILLVNSTDLILLLLTAVVSWALWISLRRQFLLSLLIPDIAVLQKINLKHMHFLRNVMAGLAIAFVIQAVGMLLSMSLLTIPPLTARLISQSPGTMILFTCLIAAIDLSIGFIGGIYFDCPLGAMMSACSLFVFIAVKIYVAQFKRNFSQVEVIASTGRHDA